MGGDIGDVNLKRTVEEIKRLQEEASSLRQENIQLKVSVRDHTFEAKIEALPGVASARAPWVGFTLIWVFHSLAKSLIPNPNSLGGIGVVTLKILSQHNRAERTPKQSGTCILLVISFDHMS